MPVVLANIVQRADVWMIERGHGACFTIEALAQLRIGGERERQHLDRHRTIESRVAGTIDLAHASGTQGGKNPVWSDRASRGEAQSAALT